MKVRMLAITCIASLAVPAVRAETSEQFLELLRSDLRTQKVAVVTAAMNLKDPQSAAFWPVYREYEAEVTKMWDERLSLLKDYAANVDAITDVKSEELAKKMLDLEDRNVKLRKKYFDKVSKAVSPTVAARFLQVESQIAAVVQTQIASEVPLIEKPE